VIRFAATVLILASLAAADDRHLGTIDFYGYTGLDLNQLRAALPYHEGDPLPSKQALREAGPAYAKAAGRDRVEMETICCQPDGRWALFVGFADPGAPPLVFHPQPKGNMRLPAEALKVSQDSDRLNSEGVKKGVAGEDDSKGYSLSEYEPARAMQLKLREYARAHVGVLLSVLESCPVDQERAAAAEALGYADESRRQIAGLVRSSLDPDDEVRNNAIRALGVLVEFDPKTLKQIPLRPYVALIYSIDWYDRNKTAALLDSFTKSRDPEVLRTLRSEALVPLREIAQWRSSGHSESAITVLGRIAGIDDNRIIDLIVAHNIAPILDALR